MIVHLLYVVFDSKVLNVDQINVYLSSSISTELNLTLFKWIRGTEKKPQANAMITLPVYLNATRSELLFPIELESADNSLNEFHFYERGVAVLSSSIA